MKTLRVLASRLLPAQVAYAHCDIPCGIYDPHQAQLGALTVIRMVHLINELKKESDTPEAKKAYLHQLARYTHVKEDHAELVKREVRILWGDYFKQEHLKDHPNLHELVFKTMKLASKARQEVNLETSEELLATVQQIAQIFWKTKGKETVRVAAPSPSGGEIVLPE